MGNKKGRNQFALAVVMPFSVHCYLHSQCLGNGEVGGNLAIKPSFFNTLQGGGADFTPPCQFPDAYALRLALICDALADFCLCHS